MRAALCPTSGLALVGSLVLACQPALEPAPGEGPADGATARGIYLPVTPMTSRALASDPGALALDQPLPIYLHRHGGTYFGGQDDSAQNRSIVVGNGSATLSAFAGGDAVWSDLKDCVVDQFARFNAYITDVEPQGGDYIEAVVGGTPQQVGLPQGVGGVAPIDTFQCNIIPRAIVYVFSGALPNDAQVLCEVAAQEIAHALSLDHEMLCEDPMTYLSGCGAKTFQDQAASCGEFSARECDCGRPSQNSVQLLYEKLGPSDGSTPTPPPLDDQGPPSVAIASPSDGAVLPPNSAMEVVATADDDSGVASVELVWEHTGDVFPCPVVGQGFRCQLEGGSYVWELNVGTGARTFQVRARDVAGNVVETPAHTISLDESGGVPVDPVQDAAAPEAELVSPADGAVLSANAVIEIIASVTDDVDVASVELEWDYNDVVLPCPVQQQAVTCSRQGSTYRWQVNVGTGERTFRVRATDGAGRVTTTPSRTISLSEGAVLPPEDDDYEDNDTWDTATTLPCSSGLDLELAEGDVDWLRVSAAPGVSVTAQLRSLDGAALSLTLASGPRSVDVLAQAETSDTVDVSGTTTTSFVGIRVESAGGAGSYRVVATCTAPSDDGTPNPPPADDGSGGDLQDPPHAADGPNVDVGGTRVTLREVEARSGCSSSRGGDALSWSFAGLLLLLVRRRRR